MAMQGMQTLSTVSFYKQAVQEMDVAESHIKIESEDDLTPDTLSLIISQFVNINKNNDAAQEQQKEHSAATNTTPLTFPHIQIEFIDKCTIEAGVLSLCLDITLHYHVYTDDNKNDDSTGKAIVPPPPSSNAPKRLVAKFLRKEMPLPHMMLVEQEFYLHHAKFLSDVLDIPFVIPQAIYCSPTAILLERLPKPPYQTFTCVEGVLPDTTRRFIRRLAIFHAKCWGYGKHDKEQDNNTKHKHTHKHNPEWPSTSQLSQCPGIGAALDGLTKERNYPQCWEGFLRRIPHDKLDHQQHTSIRHIMSMLYEWRIIRTIHTFVQGELCAEEENDTINITKSTMIHGDFHIANLLFGDEEDSDTICLLDWATCGVGNPLRDLAFFTVLCMDLDSLEDAQNVVRLYYDTLVSPGSSTSSPHSSSHIISNTMSFALCFKHYRYSILNQFALLVCYDPITQQVLDSYDAEDESSSSETKKKPKEVHFAKVYERTVKAVLACWNTPGSLSELALMSPRKTFQDGEEENLLDHVPFHPIV
jgi:hypothetical protein